MKSYPTKKLRQLKKSMYSNANCACFSVATAFKNKGVQPLLDAIIDYLPSPMDLDDVVGFDVKNEDKITQEKGS